MPPEDRVVPRFAAEPPQELLPYGNWADALREAFLAAVGQIEPEAGVELGEVREIRWHPDRSWNGRTYVPAAAPTSTGLEVFGYVSFVAGEEVEERTDFEASAEYTDETAEQNPEWSLDLCDEELGRWRGEEGRQATIRLIWGSPLDVEGAIVTAELAGLAVDQCVLVDGRFALIAPDDYRNDTLEIVLWNRRGDAVARESFEEEDDGDDDGAAQAS
ncbi:MAG TPA: hypothetical protein VK279_05310 [Solirubrobacteraceae bacterium]|nr:hypothetical protein [Solirubrobacteraceae bacterium]